MFLHKAGTCACRTEIFEAPNTKLKRAGSWMQRTRSDLVLGFFSPRSMLVRAADTRVRGHAGADESQVAAMVTDPWDRPVGWGKSMKKRALLRWRRFEPGSPRCEMRGAANGLWQVL